MLEEIVEVSEALRSGAIGANELLDRSLARISDRDPALNSFVALDVEGARAAARDSEARLAEGRPRSALEGIPVSVKDNMLARGLPATWGSRAFADFVPDEDELPVARLRAAGAVILGKTNAPELTVQGYTDNVLFGPTRNPWNPALTPGGSSGGAAASVAAGLVPGALGTDGGGSTRRPACHTGLVGWKPSTGHFARVGGFPTILSDFETAGTLTRTVEDAALMDAVLRGPDPRDRRSILRDAGPWPKRPLRVLYVPRFGDSPVDPEVAEGCAAFARSLAERGDAVEEGAFFLDIDALNRIWKTISFAGVAYMLGWRGGALRHCAGPSIAAMFPEAEAITGADYVGALEAVAEARAQAAQAFARYDLVVTPAAAALPWPADQAYPTVIDGQAAGPRAHAIFTGWANICGLPAIALPAGLSRSGLPFGVQIVAGFARDAALLDFAVRAMRGRAKLIFPAD